MTSEFKHTPTLWPFLMIFPSERPALDKHEKKKLHHIPKSHNCPTEIRLKF